MPKVRGLPALLPAPKRAEARAGSFALRDGVPIVLAPGAGDAVHAAAQILRERVREICGTALVIESHARSADLGPRIELRREGAAGESYRLTVDGERITAAGAGPAGVRYAVETLTQLVTPRGRVPACAIEDAPDFALRGVMLDISRGKVPTLAALVELVDVCARLKLNALMLYVEHTFQFRRHPEIGAGASPLSAGDLLELDAYAAAQHVELIPSLQSLGHMDHVLTLPAYAHLAETDLRWTISPSLPGTYELLADLFDEFLPNFRSERFNANCDEPYDLERGASAERARQLGPGGVYLGHVRRVRDLARSHGKRAMIWGDVVHAHPERIPEIDRDFVMLDWWYEAKHDYERVKRFAENDLDFVVCPGTSTWNSLFPRVSNSDENIARYADAGRRHGAEGLLVTDWGDFGHYNLQGNSWLAYAWAAQQAWSGATSRAAFDRGFARVLFGDPSGETARLYRELGAVHDPGFSIFNGSPLLYLYFDDLEAAYFIDATVPGALRTCLQRLDRLAKRMDAATDCFAREGATLDELRYAVAASRFALRKAQRGRAYIAWRRRPASLDAAGRRGLASALSDLADEQVSLGRTLRQLWLRRSRPGGFDLVKRRLDRSVRSLRRATRALRNDRPTAPPPPHPGFDTKRVQAAVLASCRGR